jgi:hypothetical protein
MYTLILIKMKIACNNFIDQQWKWNENFLKDLSDSKLLWKALIKILFMS